MIALWLSVVAWWSRLSALFSLITTRSEPVLPTHVLDTVVQIVVVAREPKPRGHPITHQPPPPPPGRQLPPAEAPPLPSQSPAPAVSVAAEASAGEAAPPGASPQEAPSNPLSVVLAEQQNPGEALKPRSASSVSDDAPSPAFEEPSKSAPVEKDLAAFASPASTPTTSTPAAFATEEVEPELEQARREPKGPAGAKLEPKSYPHGDLGLTPYELEVVFGEPKGPEGTKLETESYPHGDSGLNPSELEPVLGEPKGPEDVKLEDESYPHGDFVLTNKTELAAAFHVEGVPMEPEDKLGDMASAMLFLGEPKGPEMNKVDETGPPPGDAPALVLPATLAAPAPATQDWRPPSETGSIFAVPAATAGSTAPSFPLPPTPPARQISRSCSFDSLLDLYAPGSEAVDDYLNDDNDDLWQQDDEYGDSSYANSSESTPASRPPTPAHRRALSINSLVAEGLFSPPSEEDDAWEDFELSDVSFASSDDDSPPASPPPTPPAHRRAASIDSLVAEGLFAPQPEDAYEWEDLELSEFSFAGSYDDTPPSSLPPPTPSPVPLSRSLSVNSLIAEGLFHKDTAEDDHWEEPKDFLWEDWEAPEHGDVPFADAQDPAAQALSTEADEAPAHADDLAHDNHEVNFNMSLPRSAKDMFGDEAPDLMLTRLLGRGGYSHVYEGYRLDQLGPIHKREHYALKVGTNYNVWDKEMDWYRSPGDYICTPVGGDCGELFTFVVYPRATGDLCDLVLGAWRESDRNGALALAGGLIDVLRGLAAIHAKGVIHNDIKAENILVFEDNNGYNGYRAKLGDLGLAEDISATGSTTSRQGTRSYFAPEKVLEKPANAASDIFAVGAMAYDLFCGNYLFGRDTNEETYRAILAGAAVRFQGNTDPLWRTPFGEALQDFILLLCDEDWKKRPTAKMAAAMAIRLRDIADRSFKA